MWKTVDKSVDMCIKDMFFISPFENGHKGTW
jgi:hypothetical protein